MKVVEAAIAADMGHDRIDGRVGLAAFLDGPSVGCLTSARFFSC